MALDAGSVDAIVTAWREQTRTVADPTPRSGDRGDAERALVQSLLAACVAENMDDEILRAVAMTAVRYGTECQCTRVDPSHLLQELDALRRATFGVLRTSTPTEASQHIIRFDRALSVAYRASLRSSHRPPSAPSTNTQGEDSRIADDTLREARSR